MIEEYKERRRRELDLIKDDLEFVTSGYCYVCGRDRSFKTDFLYCDGKIVQGKLIPNWRERVVCTGCDLNNRARASIHFFEQFLQPSLNSSIFISEQATPLYAYLARKYPGLIGSEYFGDRIPYGETDQRTGFRNESATQLSFANASLDFNLSFDVFEHIPNYLVAFEECLRVLKPGGSLLFTVPFDKGSYKNLVRARVGGEGRIEHLCEPEYHGDPINAQGCLCFYTFGWQILDELKRVGFSSAVGHFYWSDQLGYLGQEQFVFTAHKGNTVT